MKAFPPRPFKPRGAAAGMLPVAIALYGVATACPGSVYESHTSVALVLVAGALLAVIGCAMAQMV